AAAVAHQMGIVVKIAQRAEVLVDEELLRVEAEALGDAAQLGHARRIVLEVEGALRREIVAGLGIDEAAGTRLLNAPDGGRADTGGIGDGTVRLAASARLRVADKDERASLDRREIRHVSA